MIFHIKAAFNEIKNIVCSMLYDSKKNTALFSKARLTPLKKS
jgi:hypothetical protein